MAVDGAEDDDDLTRGDLWSLVGVNLEPSSANEDSGDEEPDPGLGLGAGDVSIRDGLAPAAGEIDPTKPSPPKLVAPLGSHRWSRHKLGSDKLKWDSGDKAIRPNKRLFEEIESVAVLEEAQLGPQRGEDEDVGHFDFIEVGTSDWGTITQYCAGLKETESGLGSMMLISAQVREAARLAKLPGSIIRADGHVFLPQGSITLHLANLKPVSPVTTACADAAKKPRTINSRPKSARGIAVEAVQEHLDALPALPHVTKVQAAMDEQCGDGKLYLVSGENVNKYMRKYYAQLPGSRKGKKVDVMWYAKSLASLGSPQPELLAMLEQIERIDLLEERPVPVLDWAELCRQQGVRSVDVVQIDCEGKDCAIVRGLLEHCKENPAAFPRLIQFEANHLTLKEEVKETIGLLKQQGYRKVTHSRSNVLMQRKVSSAEADGAGADAGAKAVQMPKTPVKAAQKPKTPVQRKSSTSVTEVARVDTGVKAAQQRLDIAQPRSKAAAKAAQMHTAGQRKSPSWVTEVARVETGVKAPQLQTEQRLDVESDWV